MTTAYPLQWPAGWPRTKSPQGARFSCTFGDTRDGVLHELRLLGARDVVMSTNVELRRDGLPYASYKASQIGDTAVAVYFTLDGQQQCIPCDKWNKIEHNLRAIEKTVEALRGLERWGAKEMVKAAFRGFQALPPPSEYGWWQVLGIDRTASEDDIKAAYRELAKELHPDKGGDPAEFQTLVEAYEQAIA